MSRLLIAAIVGLSILVGCAGGGEDDLFGTPVGGLIERVSIQGSIEADGASVDVFTNSTVTVEVTAQPGATLNELIVAIDPAIASSVIHPGLARIFTDAIPGPYAVTLTALGERADGLPAVERFEFTLEVDPP